MNDSAGETVARLVCPACATPVSATAGRCPACGTAITGMASTHVDQTAADFGADQVDATLSGPGDTDGGVPWAPSEPPAYPERTAAKRERDRLNKRFLGDAEGEGFEPSRGLPTDSDFEAAAYTWIHGSWS